VVKAVAKKFKPKHGYAHFFHLGLISIVPILALIFIRLDVYNLAIAIVILAKWRMLAVQPRHWIAHVRTNAVDLIVSLSIVSFMIESSDSYITQLVWLVLFEVWLLYVKPGTSSILVGIQALTAQFAGLVAMFLAFEKAPIIFYVIGAAAIGYFSIRHFLNAFEESHGVQYSWMWAFFSASLVWILSHWLLFYGPIAQPAVFLSIIAYGLCALYYLHEHDKITMMVRRQIIFVVFAVLFVMLAFSNWGDGVIK